MKRSETLFLPEFSCNPGNYVADAGGEQLVYCRERREGNISKYDSDNEDQTVRQDQSIKF